MKTLLFMICVVYTLASHAYLYPFNENNAKDLEGLNQKQIAQLIKYNIGLVEHVSQDQQKAYEQLIISFGKRNVLTPTEMNYLILIESDKLFSGQEAKQQRITEGYAQSFKVLEKEQRSIMETLFGHQADSLIQKANALFNNNNLGFKIYQNEDDLDINYLQWTITLYLGKNNEVYFYEPKKDKSYKIEQSLEKCVDNFFGTTFDYAPKDNKIYKYNTNEILDITKDNQDHVTGFLKDICAMNKLATIFKKNSTPNMLSIINKSIAKLEKILNEQEIDLVYDMMRIAHKKLSKNFRNTFESEDLFGLILIEEEKNPQITTTKESAQVQRILMETRTRMLNQVTQTNSSNYVMNATTYQIYVWFGVFFVIVLIGIIYSMVTMDIQKDTLLYAKFLTTDQRN
ncbi:unnamed protein product (macronuclear) [Paramecium tetraurelia]|uniref:Renin receptor-like C-terminal transmembrane spanning segment domain-containing protein n=1 Tax=Paramecium tetraurelia TaxID=5888 RepID=A0D9Z9_PARTE|nr:uncharacterized protein GSPATT00014798001 [Paramecium tetraurelia]CAK79866.1 unnamed protein product [Paramecium tetraurelia]|eukprot:XP_001447263.1 hypothetical protein (macronuclear) [Paramecium tetraurelia strain d4-2]